MATLTTINSGGVKDDSIVNADIKSDAAIALSKLASTPAVLTGSTDNTITTVTGANAIQGEQYLTFNGTGDLRVIGDENTAANLFLVSDQSDNTGDEWRLASQVDNYFQISNDNSGSFINHVSISKIGDSTHFGTGGNQHTFRSDSYCILNIDADSNNDETNTDSILRFQTNSSTTAETRYDESADLLELCHGSANDHLVIDSNGNVGIGVAASKKLHVKGLDVALRLESTAATGRIGMEFYDTSAQKGFFGYPSSGNDNMAIQQNEAADLYFYVNGADRLHIKSDGKVGIGTDSPNRVFSVKGNGGQMSIIDDDDSMMQFYVNSGTGSIWATGGSSIAGALDFATTPSGGSTTSRMQISAAGDVTVNTGSIIMANSGEGIQFHPHDEAVSNPGSDSNTLDDYEEGTFTPTVGTNGTDFSTWPGYTVQTGEYTKVGNLVTCNIYLSWNNAGAGGSGTIGLFGLPFTISSHGSYTGVSFGWQYWLHQGMNQNNYITAYGQSGQAYMLFLYQRTYNGSAGNTNWGMTYTVCDASFAHAEASFSCTISYQI